jgi:restriction endonuclease TaqI-like protein
MIVSNKFLRANYGEPLRRLIAANFGVERITDFAGLPVFKGATVRTLVLFTSRDRRRTETLYSPPLPIGVFRAVETGRLSVDQAVSQSTFEVDRNVLTKSTWSFAESSVLDLLAKIRACSQSLRQYCDGSIFMGVKSGLTEAFVIDAATRAKIVRSNPAAAEILKPFLHGRDVRRYIIAPTQTYLIYTFHGVDITRYPGIEEHLKPFKETLRKRATNQKWYELQQPQRRFSQFMEAPKIIFPDIATSPRFTLDRRGHYGANTTYFIAREDFYLLGLLNSLLGKFYFVQTCAGLEGTGETYLRFFGQYLEGFPVRSIDIAKSADKDRHDRMVSLVERMLESHKELAAAKSEYAKINIQRQIDATDSQIDKLAYELYELTPDEIKIVEEAAK